MVLYPATGGSCDEGVPALAPGLRVTAEQELYISFEAYAQARN
jgi:hypothetical protein